MDQQKDFEEISAYVDGELDVEARAAVNERAARDLDYARKLATVSRLKAAVSEAVPVPELILKKPLSGRHRRRRVLALAASLVLFAAAGIWWTAYDVASTARSQPSLGWSVAVHRDWKALRSNVNSDPAVQAVSQALNPNVPDLSASGLDIVHMAKRTLPNGKEQALVIGYRGSRGCRVTMIVSKSSPNSLKQPVRMDSGAVQASMWLAGNLQYVLLAEGMERHRYGMISESVKRATTDRLPLDRNTRTLLASSRAKSPPCRA